MKRVSFVEIAAIIVGVIALVGAVVTVYMFTKNNVNVEARATAKDTLPASIAETNSSKKSTTLSSQIEPAPLTDTTPRVTPPTKPEQKDIEVSIWDDPSTGNTVAEKPAVATEKKLPKELEKKKKAVLKINAKEKEEPEKEKRRLNQVELNQLMADISILKANNTNRSACVLVQQSTASNIINGIDNVARMLQSRGYIIAGRAKIPEKTSGIIVRWPKQCITVTIGIV